MTTLFAMILQVMLTLHPAATPRSFKTVIADGSVWIDVYEGQALRMSVRLCDHTLTQLRGGK